MNYICNNYFYFIFIFFFSCVQKKQEHPKNISIKDLSINLLPSHSYEQSKSICEASRKKLLNHRMPFDSISQTFSNLLLNEIIPHWYCTPWSFEGHTEKPKKGNIACSYFTATTLMHLGMKLNRYKLAQQSPLDEAKILAQNNNIIEISSGLDDLKNKMSNQANGLYFMGLAENHVGFLLKRKGYLLFIESGYLDPKEVKIEFVGESQVLKGFQQFYIVPLSTNEELMMKWVKGEEVN
ncbi:MAG: hypothetical protein RLZZ546_1099 [Bacteroidota bacterium]|jgi:hypothetical protein